MLQYAIVAGKYKQAVDCIKFHNLARDTCLVITGDYVFKKSRNTVRGLQIVFGDDAPKNSAYNLVLEELTRRMCPSMDDCVLSKAS